MTKNKLAMKRTLEELSSNIANSTVGRSAMATLTKVPEYRRQYLMAIETGEQCRKLAEEAVDPEQLKCFLEDVRKLFEQTVNVTAKKTEHALLVANGRKSKNVSEPSRWSLEDKIFALMEMWSDEKLGQINPATILERVSLTKNIADSTIKESKENIEENADIDSDIPTNLLLELATNHYNKEYVGLLSESQLDFMKQYISSDSEQFVSHTLAPLEECVGRALGALPKEEDLFAGQSQHISALIRHFKEDRTVIMENRHPQHTAAVNFYLSLVELVDRINGKE